MLPISRCPACGEAASPPRDHCARCGAESPGSDPSDGRGRVVASTWVPGAFGLEGFGPDGFGVAWVDLDDGPRVQVLVAGGPPGPDARGTVDLVVVEGVDLPVFAPEAS